MKKKSLRMNVGSCGMHNDGNNTTWIEGMRELCINVFPYIGMYMDREEHH